MAHESASPPSQAVGDIFRDLSQEQCSLIEAAIPLATCPSGHHFYAPGEPCEHLFLLKQGRVQIYKLSSEGRMLRLGTVEAVTVFGEIPLNPQKTHTNAAEAITPCTVGYLNAALLQTILQSYPQVTRRLLEVMGQRIGEMETRLGDIAFKSVPQRLATTLLALARTPPHPDQLPPPPAVVHATHQQLAEMIGSYRETVTRTIGEFREDGMIRIEDDGISLINQEKLQQLINGE
ncbi:MAG: Crp/Fnr family transcriptional regulator [Chloroflexaceae bacterium]|nr:Crp/Fnr family transcriptional regulator [Chloroflexaceae bacterium]